MGWFNRTFGFSKSAKIERAEHHLDHGRYAAALRELDELTGEAASNLRSEANLELLDLNLNEAKARYNSGDAHGAQEHIDIARSLGATDDQIRTVRRHINEINRERAIERQVQKEARKPKMTGDPDSIWALPPDHPKLRYAFRIESYPLELQERLIDLGEDFATAVIQIEDGDPNAAYQRISRHIERDPVAYLERSRAALQAGQIANAASDLQSFGSHFEHGVIGNTHTGALWISLLARLGRVQEALQKADELRKEKPHPALDHIRSQILEAHGELHAAEKSTAKLLKESPNNLPLIRQLARIRLKLGDRNGAAAVLESGLTRCCTPGSCSSQPFDVQSARMLSQIYLEDRYNKHRSDDLLQKISQNIKSPEWIDQYILALNARNEAQPFAQNMAENLLAGLSETDPRQSLIKKAFPGLAV